jgi:hypothetical protein
MMEQRAPKQAFVEIKPRDNHGVNFPERYLKVTSGIVRQGQRSLIAVSDAGHHPFALLVAVDALVSDFGQATLEEEGIAVPENFFMRRKDESGWHRDEVLAALEALHLRLERERVLGADHSQDEPRASASTLQDTFDAAYELRRARVGAR